MAVVGAISQIALIDLKQLEKKLMKKKADYHQILK
jgi:hypothetical protein